MYMQTTYCIGLVQDLIYNTSPLKKKFFKITIPKDTDSQKIISTWFSKVSNLYPNSVIVYFFLAFPKR